MKQIVKLVQVLVLVLLWAGAQAQYCTPTYSTGCTFGDGLTLFQLGNINQTIPCSGSPAWYHDYTGGTQGTLWTGVGATLTVQSGYSSTHVTVYIDLNNNNAFDAGEVVVTDLVCANSGTNYTATITVPTGSTLGTHRLRYRTNWLSAVTGPCTTISYGNASDFTVNVTLPPPVGILQGTVTNTFGGAALNGVQVTVNAMTPVNTNGSGYYQKTNIPAGTATVHAVLSGFQDYNSSATITSGQTTVKDFQMTPVPSYLTGYVTNAGTNGPIHGALISVGTGTTFTYSMPDGYYYFQAYPAGSQTVNVSKPGFITNSNTVNITQGGTTTYNVALQVTAYPPGPVTATLNAGETAVDINWSAPTGLYEMIYDDGGQENWTVWATAGNMNALKFTPITGSVKVMAGMIDIGTAANYAAGTDPTALAPFQLAIFDATGPAGTPGAQIEVADVVPTNFGWNTVTFSGNTTVTGNFYLVLIQGGTPPNAAGLAVDETTNKLRSYSKYVTGNGPWLPASGNYMLRAVVSGQGGPLDIDRMALAKEEITASPIDQLIYDHKPAVVTGYEGAATFQAVNWSSFTNVANIMKPSTPANGTYTQGMSTDVDQSGSTTQQATYTPTLPDAPLANLFDNGPAFNSTGTGTGGGNESIYYQGGTGTYGSGCQYSAGVYVADDFIVPSGKTWAITSMNFYSYQTNSTTTSTITGIYMRIWNGKPGVTGSTVVWGNMTSNRLSSTTFANIYRVMTVAGGNARPVMSVVASTPGLSLSAGTYWVEWACTGSLTSGPWAPPVVTANNVTGNAIQTVDAGATYADVLYNTYGQGFPFVIQGNEITPGGIPYTVWRLLEGQESTPALWGAPIASNISATSVTDNAWPSLPCGPYRWAVEAGYPVNRLSAPTFSNVIGKCWTAQVTVNVSLTCAASPVGGTIVKLQNSNFSQYAYTATTTTTGTVSFPAVWKGNYDLYVMKAGYDTYHTTAVIMGDQTFDVTLLQTKLGPSNMFVDNKTLMSSWNAPVGIAYALNEDWAAGNFTTNGWTAEGNWFISTATGNPAPSASFSWTPSITNYSRSLTSKTLTGSGAPSFKLKYDISLDNYSTTSVENMDVEIQIGSGSWTALKHYDNQGGSFAFTTESVDIASVGAQNFKVRFRANGANSYDINYWYIDNVQAVSVSPDPKPCILAYNVYLNGVLDGVTLDTTYQIPPSHVTYGTVYNACVKAVYGSGYSAPSCYSFTNKWLYPPTNLQVSAVECVAYLTWEKPTVWKKTHVPAYRGTVEHTQAFAGLAPIDRSQVPPVSQQSNGSRGSIAFGFEAVNAAFIDFDIDNLSGLTNLGPNPASNFIDGMVYPVNETNLAYAIVYGLSTLFTVDHTTLAWTSVGSLGGATFNEITVDKTTGTIYADGLTNLYSIDPTGPSATLIGSYGGPTLMIAIACDGNGDCWGYDISTDLFYSIDKTTGTATTVGSIGYDAGYAQSMFYDQATDQVIMGGFNAGNLTAEIRAVDVTTGASTILSSFYYNEVTAGTIPVTSGGGSVSGLLGYKIYRDGAQVHYVGDPDTLFWYDFTVEPGSHEYAVSAWYDLTDYGFPGQFDESMLEGPKTIDIECGRELPFCEDWSSGSFTFNQWVLSNPTNTNWSVDPAVGHPVPSANFSWQPIQYDYELSIESPVLNGGPFTCSTIWCDFDYKLVDRNMTGNEKLEIDVFSKGAWKNKAELTNTGSKDWTTQHIDISSVKGKAFKVRVRAIGANSADILHWYVDNICVYAICNPPVTLTASPTDEKTITLTWHQPECGTSASFTPTWLHWDDGTNFTSIGTGGATNFDIAARWDATQIAAYDGGQITKVAFYPASAGTAAYSIRIWQGADAATLLVDQAVASPTLDDWNIIDVASPVPLDVTQELWVGVNVNASGGYPAGCDAGPQVDGYGNMIYFNGAWATLTSLNPALTYNWNVQGYVEPMDDHAKKITPLPQNTVAYKSGGILAVSNTASKNTMKFNPLPDNGGTNQARSPLGYNVYRSDDTLVSYHKLNGNTLVADTFYVNTITNYGTYYYFVTAVFPTYPGETCESDSSNIVKVNWWVGMDQLNGGKITVYPNPASDNVIVKSDYTITNIEVLDYIGQAVYTRKSVGDKNVKVNVANFTPGIYFVKVTTEQGIRTVKITVTR
jgi:hypothetical protein